MVRIVLMIHKGAGLAGKGLIQIIRERFSKIEQEVCDNSDIFLKRMCQPIRCRENEICVVLADTRDRLEQLMGMEKLFERRRLLLILPENNKKMFSKGLRLLPRYMGSMMDDHEEILSVIEKMVDMLKSSDRNGARGNSDNEKGSWAVKGQTYV